MWLDHFSKIHPPFSVLGPQGMSPGACPLSPGMTVVRTRLSWTESAPDHTHCGAPLLPAEFFTVFNNVPGHELLHRWIHSNSDSGRMGFGPPGLSEGSAFSQHHPPSYNKAEPSTLALPSLLSQSLGTKRVRCCCFLFVLFLNILSQTDTQTFFQTLCQPLIFGHLNPRMREIKVVSCSFFVPYFFFF